MTKPWKTLFERVKIHIPFLILMVAVIGIEISNRGANVEEKNSIYLYGSVIAACVVEAINIEQGIKNRKKAIEESKTSVVVCSVSEEAEGKPRFILNPDEIFDYGIVKCLVPHNNQYFIPVLNEEESPGFPINYELKFEGAYSVSKLTISRISYSVRGIIGTKDLSNKKAEISQIIPSGEAIKICILLPFTAEEKRRIADEEINLDMQIEVCDINNKTTLNTVASILVYSDRTINLVTCRCDNH